MTGALADVKQQGMQRVASELQATLDQLQPLLRQMHLLSSNAVSSAARAGSDGDAFRVLTQAIQQLGQDINHDVQQVQHVLQQLNQNHQPSKFKSLVRQLENALAELPIAIRKGEYLAICCSVEAAHTEKHADSFDSVASMLKQLIASLRLQVSQQQDTLAKLQELI